MNDDTNDWRELREFAGVELTDSFVLSWDYAGGALLIDIDVCLAPSHPFYEKPRPAEGACIRAATLEFPYCTSLTAGSGNDPAETVRTLGNGRIDGLRRTGDGRYEMTGAFGRIEIVSERPLLRLKGAIAP